MLTLLTLVSTLAQAPVQPAQLSGRIVEQGSGAPIAGARVVLVRRPQGPPAPPMGTRPPLTMSDADGHFTFTDIDPGTYVVTVEKAGFAGMMPASGNPPSTVDLSAGAHRDDVVVTMQRGGAIAGRVVDVAGEPMSGIRVMAMRRRPAPPRAPPNAMAPRLVPAGAGAQTDDLGEFRLFSLAPGEYYVQAMQGFMGPLTSSSASSGAPVVIPTYYPGTSDDATAQSITVAGGQTVRDVLIPMRTASAFAISGVVVDDSGLPVSNALVRLTPSGGGSPFIFGPPAEGRTNAQGRFVLTGVTNGAYTVVAVPPRVLSTGGTTAWASGYNSTNGTAFTSSETRNGVTTQYQGADGTSAPVTVNEGDVIDLRITVHRLPPP